MNDSTLTILLIGSGIGHIASSLGSIAVPTLLDWKKHIDAVPTLMRQVFWVYSAYIKMIGIAFGIVSILGRDELLASSFLAKSINLFIVIYWTGRLAVGFIYYDRSTLTGIAKLSDRTLNVLIVFFIVVHGMAFARNMMWM
jgi:hypothetical protein